MLTVHTIKNKKFGMKLPSVRERRKTVDFKNLEKGFINLYQQYAVNECRMFSIWKRLILHSIFICS